MSRHYIEAEIEVEYGPPRPDQECAYPLLGIEFSYAPGGRQTWDSPGWAAEIEILSVKLLKGDGLLPTPQQIEEWADKWLGAAGHDQCLQLAKGDDYWSEVDRGRQEAKDREI